MEKIQQWPIAQKDEKHLWDGVIQHDHYILRVLADNSVKVPKLRDCLPRTPQNSLEIGIGPFGLGISAFLPEIPNRFAVDPLPPISFDSPADKPVKSSEDIRSYLRQIRSGISYVIGYGEEIPVRSESLDLVICCNVLDHCSQPDAILREIHRILKPDGSMFFDVDTFSVLGLVKWHLWTKRTHKNEILVTTHPYRMYEADVVQRLQAAGFQLRKLGGHTFSSNLIGHARDTTFLASKCPS